MHPACRTEKRSIVIARMDNPKYKEITVYSKMKRLIAYVSGDIQQVGYRAKVIDIARAFGLKGMIENLKDGRVLIIADGDDKKLEWFENAIDIKNTLIQVTTIEKEYSTTDGKFDDFGKLVFEGETDSRLDKGVEVMKEILIGVKDINKTLINMNSDINNKLINMNSDINTNLIDINSDIKDINTSLIDMNSNLGGKMDQIKEDTSAMLQKQDTSIGILKEVKEDTSAIKADISGLRKDASESLYEKYEQLCREIAEIKATLSEIKAKAA